jgi:hypothetical protein
MSPAEVAHRARIGLRDRLLPAAYARWPATEAGERLFEGGAEAAWRASRLARWVHPPEPAEAFAPAVAAARELLAGRWSLFGHAVTLDDPPRWSRNAVTGAEWPALPSRELDWRRSDLAGGAKFAWEAGRLTMLPTLALAARLTGEAPFAERATRWLDDFTARNPLGHGIHHRAGIEMAVRVLTVSWTLALLGERAGAARLDACLGLLAQQARHCRDHLSLGSSANNHLIAEYAGPTTLAAAFPALRGGRALLDRGLAGLERETLRQIHEDGVPAEQAFGYLPFVWELLLVPFIAAEIAGETVSGAVRERLRASLEFARAIRLPDGSWPRVGDEDDGRVLLACEGASRLDRVGNALAAWLDADALADVDPALALLLTGRIPRPARPAADARHTFHVGGYTVWRGRGLVVTFDHGPLGLGSLAAHGHADALSLTIFRGVDPIAIDPGTLAYQEDAEARDRGRGTPAHGTVHFGGRSQSEMRGAFLWGRRAAVRAAGDAFECRWAGGETHARRVEVEDGRIRVDDRVHGAAPELVFALAPRTEIELAGNTATVASGGSRAVFESRGVTAWRLEPAEAAPRFGQREPAARLVAAIEGETCHTEVTVGER